MTVFAGIDGGQSSTLAALGDLRAPLGRGYGPPADLVGEARDSQRQRDALEAALDAALDDAGLDRSVRFRAIVAGISGFETSESRVPDLTARAQRIRVVHDTEIAHAGALDGAAGIVVVAGTGSVALGNAVSCDTAPGDTAPPGAGPGDAYVRAGGWGYFFGDEGSALWVARTALRRAMLRYDRNEPSALGELARATYGTASLRAIQDAFAHGELGRPALAAFAPDVLDAAARGDGDALAIRHAAGHELASLAATVDGRLGPSPSRLVSYAGGLFADGGLAEAFGRALRALLPHATLVSPIHDPAAGALLLARRLA